MKPNPPIFIQKIQVKSERVEEGTCWEMKKNFIFFHFGPKDTSTS